MELQIDCGSLQQRFTHNNNGFPNNAKVCRSGFSAVQGQEQGKENFFDFIHNRYFGIMNARMWCKGDGHFSDSNTNHNGVFKNKLDCGEKVLTGMEVRELGGHGIVNFKAFCTSLPDGEQILVIRNHFFKCKDLNSTFILSEMISVTK